MRQRCFACVALAWIENSVRCPEINLAPMTVYGPRTYRREHLGTLDIHDHGRVQLLRCCLRYQTTVCRIAFSDRVAAAWQGLFTRSLMQCALDLLWRDSTDL